MKKRRILTVILISAMALVTLFAAACTTDKKNVTFYASGCDHEWVNDEDFYTTPTCTEKGRSRNVCLNCGEVGDVTETPALGHLLVTETHSATCTEYGYSKAYCTREGCDYETSTSSDGYLASHTWSDEPMERKDATCTEDGRLVYVCAVCGERDERTISAFGHTWVYSGETTIEGDDGEETAAFLYECSKCGTTKAEAYADDADDVVEKKETCEHEYGSFWLYKEYEPARITIRYKVCLKCGAYGCFEIAPEEVESTSMPWYIVVMYVLLALVIVLLVAFAVYVAVASVKKRKNGKQ